MLILDNWVSSWDPFKAHQQPVQDSYYLAEAGVN